jgi:tRNA A37 methylthiotransferase MiaB
MIGMEIKDKRNEILKELQQKYSGNTCRKVFGFYRHLLFKRTNDEAIKVITNNNERRSIYVLRRFSSQ